MELFISRANSSASSGDPLDDVSRSSSCSHTIKTAFERQIVCNKKIISVHPLGIYKDEVDSYFCYEELFYNIPYSFYGYFDISGVFVVEKILNFDSSTPIFKHYKRFWILTNYNPCVFRYSHDFIVRTDYYRLILYCKVPFDIELLKALGLLTQTEVTQLNVLSNYYLHGIIPTITIPDIFVKGEFLVVEQFKNIVSLLESEYLIRASVDVRLNFSSVIYMSYSTDGASKDIVIEGDLMSLFDLNNKLFKLIGKTSYERICIFTYGFFIPGNVSYVLNQLGYKIHYEKPVFLIGENRRVSTVEPTKYHPHTIWIGVHNTYTNRPLVYLTPDGVPTFEKTQTYAVNITLDQVQKMPTKPNTIVYKPGAMVTVFDIYKAYVLSHEKLIIIGIPLDKLHGIFN